MTDYPSGRLWESTSDSPMSDTASLSPVLPELQRALFALNAPAWCWHVYDSQLEVNDAFRQQFGVDAESLGDLLGLLDPASAEQLLMSVGRALRRKNPFSISLSILASSEPMRLWCSPLELDGRQLMLGTMLEAEPEVCPVDQSLLHPNMELQLLLDSMRSAIWYMDRWGMVQHGNQKAAEWMPLDRAMGRSFLEVMPDWDDVAERHREIMQVIRTGTPRLGNLESRCVDEAVCWYRVDKIPTYDIAQEVSGVLLVISDVTEVMVKERALKESEARYRAFIANSSEAMYRFDLSPAVDVNDSASRQPELIFSRATLAECNHATAKLFGAHSPKELVGLPMEQAVPKVVSSQLQVFVVNGYRLEDVDVEYITADGLKKSIQISAIGIVENGYLIRLWGTTRDVTEKKRYLDRLEYQATHDSLTLLPNRNKLYQDLEVCLRDRKQDQKVALMLLDLDRFKEINDTLGHQAGDKLLKQIGPRLEMELAEFPAVVARLGGDEFAILLSRIRNNQQAVVIGHRVLDAIRQPFELEGLHTEISVSVGIVICPDQAQDVSTLMRYADVAMYHAKTERIGVSIYQAKHDPHTPKRLALMSDLGRAIRGSQLELYYQPKIDIKRRLVYGFEALLRWNHPEMGFIPPTEFIPLVEMTELIHPMTLWVIESSIVQAKKWQAMGFDFSVAANLSAQNLLGDSLSERIEVLLEHYDLPPEKLEIEITESIIMVDPERALKVLKAIAALGVTLAIDDFGTGYSSLAYLKRLPVQTLKIDRSFVTGMLDDEQDQIIVHSTINLAHNLGLRVVAEGVEDDAVLSQLSDLECDRAQGYFIAKPQPVAELDKWLASCTWHCALAKKSS